jgi:hypothetical protein
MANPLILIGGPNGIRTRVTDVRGQCPRPLDDGTSETEPTLFNLKLTKKQRVNQELNKGFSSPPHHPPLPSPKRLRAGRHQGGGEIFGEDGVFIPLCSRMRRIIFDKEKL